AQSTLVVSKSNVFLRMISSGFASSSLTSTENVTGVKKVVLLNVARVIPGLGNCCPSAIFFAILKVRGVLHATHVVKLPRISDLPSPSLPVLRRNTLISVLYLGLGVMMADAEGSATRVAFFWSMTTGSEEAMATLCPYRIG